MKTLQENVETELGALMFKLLAAVTERDAARAEIDRLHARVTELEATQKPAE